MYFAEAVTEISMYKKFKAAVRVPLLAKRHRNRPDPSYIRKMSSLPQADMILYCLLGLPCK